MAAALRLWLKIGCIGFGGPSGQIAILHSEVVEKRGWISEEEFVRALQFCMLLPGPEAQQLATWIGWRLHGIRGGLAAGILFFLPAALLLWLLSLLYVFGRDLPLLHGFFEGLKPAVVAIVLSALWRIGRRTVKTRWLGMIALAAFLLFYSQASYPLVVMGFGLVTHPCKCCGRPREIGRPRSAWHWPSSVSGRFQWQGCSYGSAAMRCRCRSDCFLAKLRYSVSEEPMQHSPMSHFTPPTTGAGSLPLR